MFQTALSAVTFALLVALVSYEMRRSEAPAGKETEDSSPKPRRTYVKGYFRTETAA